MLTLKSVADAAAFCKQVMRPVANGHLFCSALKFGQWFKMMSKTENHEDSDGDGGDGIATEEGKGKKKAVIEVEGDLSHYSREAGNIMTNIPRSEAHHISVCEQAVHFRRKGSSHIDVLFHLNYEAHGKAPREVPGRDMSWVGFLSSAAPTRYSSP